MLRAASGTASRDSASGHARCWTGRPDGAGSTTSPLRGVRRRPCDRDADRAPGRGDEVARRHARRAGAAAPARSRPRARGCRCRRIRRLTSLPPNALDVPVHAALLLWGPAMARSLPVGTRPGASTCWTRTSRGAWPQELTAPAGAASEPNAGRRTSTRRCARCAAGRLPRRHSAARLAASCSARSARARRPPILLARGVAGARARTAGQALRLRA